MLNYNDDSDYIDYNDFLSNSSFDRFHKFDDYGFIMDCLKNINRKKNLNEVEINPLGDWAFKKYLENWM
ncbi:MAG: hypothetical protein LBM96_09395 [Methanobrevibacter sp.]|jgi:hypothetical protein|nr:hypothetical protein [Candidatus Methanoflexus mossambicus]